MNRTGTINVLWIEDDDNYKKSFEVVALERGIKFTHYTNWKEAKKYLASNIDEVHAVLFDAHCKIGENDTAGNHDFLHYAVIDMLLIFAKFHTVRPWYVLSAGTMDRFNETIKIISHYRQDFEEDWGVMLYKKKGVETQIEDEADGDVFAKADSKFDPSEVQLIEALFNSVNQPNNAMSRHADTLRYVGKDSLFKGSARSTLLALLNALYYPHNNPGHRFEGNPIRKIFESVVHTCVDYGIIPEEIRPGGNVQCQEVCRFLTGANPDKINYRFGISGDRILDSTETSILIAILASSNVASHESADDLPETDISITDNNRDEYAGCALHMCRIIKAIGKYIELHPDKEHNKALWRPNPNPKLWIGREVVVDGLSPVPHSGIIQFKNNERLALGDIVKLIQVVINNDVTHKAPYPLFALRIEKKEPTEHQDDNRIPYGDKEV